jgi:hypothetical protein
MKRGGFLTPGLRVWMIVQILFIAWMIIGSKMEIPTRILSIAGSIGLIILTALGLLGIYFFRKKRG